MAYNKHTPNNAELSDFSITNWLYIDSKHRLCTESAKKINYKSNQNIIFLISLRVNKFKSKERERNISGETDR